MNHATIPPVPPTPDDAELEARLVAWVAGEASAFEIETLQAALAARPELAVFKRRIEAVHGLVAEAACPDRAPLRLSPERRAILLQTIGVKESTTAAEPTAIQNHTPSNKSAARAKSSVLTMPLARKQPFWTQHWFYSAAACVVIAMIGSMIIMPSFQMKRKHEAPEMVSLDLMSPADDANMADPPSVEEEPPAEIARGWSVPSKHGSSRMMSSRSSHAMVALGELEKRAPASIRPRAPGSASAKQLAYGFVAAPKEQSFDHYNKLTPTTDDGTTGVMEPFEVTEESSVGYAATSTLAGTRIRTELRDIGSVVSVANNKADKDAYAPSSDNFLSKRKTERTAPKLTGKGGAATPPAPAARAPSNTRAQRELVLGGEGESAAPAPAATEDDKVVLSPFEVSADPSPGFLDKASHRPGAKQPKRPDPMATSAAMGPGDIAGLEANAAEVEPPNHSAKPVITADKPVPRPAAAPPPAPIEEVNAAQEAVSTFSLHVSDVSFKLALAALASGTWPDRATIRPEEFYNAFDYGDPATAASEKISCRIEQAAHPFAQQRNLVRIAMRVPATGRGAGQPLHLTVLLDTSGSMERPDRHATVRSALATLVGLLGPADRLTLVGFARQPRLLVEALDGNHANQALDLLDRTPAEGGTNLEEALRLGGELARRHFLATAQNRIVLLTDGAANLGNADPDRLSAAVEALRAQRIAFDACGVGLDGLDDTILEALTRKGDGRYYVLNSPESADAGFARQLAGALRPAAENVKVQVRFNPARVGRYRLVGFEKHRLREEDFRNDAVDAAELAAEEAAVAVYEIEAKPQGEGEVGEVFVRFRDAATKEMVERSWTLPYDPRAAAFDRATPSLQLAGTAAMLAEKIRGGPAGDRVELDALAPVVNAIRGRHPDDRRIQELVTMFEQLRRLQGK